MPSLLLLFGFLFSPFGINQMFLMISKFLLRYLGGKLMGSPRTSTGNHRPHLLHSWATSLFCIANKIYKKASDNRIGYLARTLVYIASFILYPMKQQWLATLSLIDDGILAAEGLVMKIFPQTADFFIKVDKLALFGQSLPQMLDHAMDDLLKSFFSKSGNSSNERDIMVDIKCDKQPKLVDKSWEEEADNRSESGRREEIAKFSHDKAWNKPSMEDDIREVEETCKGIMGALAEMGMTEKEKGVDGEMGCRHPDEKVARPDFADRKKVVKKEKGADHGEFGRKRHEDEMDAQLESGDEEGIVEEEKNHSEVGRKTPSDEKVARPDSGNREMVVVDKKRADGEVGRKRHVDETVARSQSGNEEVGRKNTILDLFDEGWQLKPIAGKKG